jgi:hypothetical protein
MPFYAAVQRLPEGGGVGESVGGALGETTEHDGLDTGGRHVPAPCALAHDHVRGLHVAMHEPGGVSLLEGAADLLEDEHHAPRRKRARIRDEIIEVAAVEVLHRVVEDPFRPEPARLLDLASQPVNGVRGERRHERGHRLHAEGDEGVKERTVAGRGTHGQNPGARGEDDGGTERGDCRTTGGARKEAGARHDEEHAADTHHGGRVLRVVADEADPDHSGIERQEAPDVDRAQRAVREAEAVAHHEHPGAKNRHRKIRGAHAGRADPCTGSHHGRGGRVADEEVQGHGARPREERGEATLKERPRLLAALRARGRRGRRTGGHDQAMTLPPRLPGHSGLP